MAGREWVRYWEYSPGATYASKFAQTLLESGTGGVEIIESLRLFKKWVEKGNVGIYLVQIVDQPHQIIVLKVRYTSLIIFQTEYFGELIVKPG